MPNSKLIAVAFSSRKLKKERKKGGRGDVLLLLYDIPPFQPMTPMSCKPYYTDHFVSLLTSQGSTPFLFIRDLHVCHNLGT